MHVCCLFLLAQVGSLGFFRTLQSNYLQAMVYEDLELQQKARNEIPYEHLSSAAIEKLDRAKASDPGTADQKHLGCKGGLIEEWMFDIYDSTYSSNNTSVMCCPVIVISNI